MSRGDIPPAHAEFVCLSKIELQSMADALRENDSQAIECCVAFVLADTRGFWHGRARAMMCRRLKHCELGRTHRDKLVSCITSRLVSGSFSEQFKDQLRLSMCLDFKQTQLACCKSLTGAKAYVRRYAEWVISHEPS